MSKITLSIGEVLDKYVICKLKSERSQIDNSMEIDEYLAEIKTYEEIEPYIEQLYNLHSEIWDLEGDIRKGRENILGLEEVGRRSVILRDMNKKRIAIKNEINCKYNEGYIEIKLDHGSEIEPSVIISLTTVPERLIDEKEDGLKRVIKSLCEQNDNDYQVYFEIPYIYKTTNEPYIIPRWLHQYKLKYPHLRIFRGEDMGPATKFVPTIKRIKNPETIMLVVDDDLIYHPDMIIEHRKWISQYPDSVIAYAGGGCNVPLYPDEQSLRDSWIACVTFVRETKSVQHYKSVSHKRKIFNEIFWKYYAGRTTCDDSLLSMFCLNEGIKMLIVPYEPENHLYETLELWNQNLKVESFPVLANSSSVQTTGANHPKRIQQPMNTGMRFFCPTSLGDRSWENGVDPDRPMGWSPTHGYFYIDEMTKKNEQSVIEEPIAPIIEEPIAPIIEEPVAPVIEEPVAPVIEEPIAPIIEEPVAPVIEEPVAPVIEEQSPTI